MIPTSYTAKERLAIYKKTLNHIQTNKDDPTFLCCVIKDIVGFKLSGTLDEPSEGMKLFPELMAIKPKRQGWSQPWWNTNSSFPRMEALKTIISGMKSELKTKK